MTSENRLLWRCTNCKICECCGTAKEDDGNCLVYCECCDQAYHMLCVVPILKEIPLGHWFCQSCVHCNKCTHNEIDQIKNTILNDGSDINIDDVRSNNNNSDNSNSNNNNIDNINNNDTINDISNINDASNINHNNDININENDYDNANEFNKFKNKSEICYDLKYCDIEKNEENCIDMKTDLTDKILSENATKDILEITDSAIRKNGKELAKNNHNLLIKNVQRSWGTCLSVCHYCEEREKEVTKVSSYLTTILILQPLLHSNI